MNLMRMMLSCQQMIKIPKLTCLHCRHWRALEYHCTMKGFKVRTFDIDVIYKTVMAQYFGTQVTCWANHGNIIV